MSLISGQAGSHERYVSDRRRNRQQMESMWSDLAARKYLDIIDELEQADREYAHALSELDTDFEEANKLLGPI